MVRRWWTVWGLLMLAACLLIAAYAVDRRDRGTPPGPCGSFCNFEVPVTRDGPEYI